MTTFYILNFIFIQSDFLNDVFVCLFFLFMGAQTGQEAPLKCGKCVRSPALCGIPALPPVKLLRGVCPSRRAKSPALTSATCATQRHEATSVILSVSIFAGWEWGGCGSGGRGSVWCRRCAPPRSDRCGAAAAADQIPLPVALSCSAPHPTPTLTLFKKRGAMRRG